MTRDPFEVGAWEKAFWAAGWGMGSGEACEGRRIRLCMLFQDLKLSAAQ